MFRPLKSDDGRKTGMPGPYVYIKVPQALHPIRESRYAGEALPYLWGSRLHRAVGWRKRISIQMTRRGSVVWVVNRAYLDQVVEELLAHFSAVELLLDYNSRTVCDRRCQNARGSDCECSCFGNHHGSGDAGRGWVSISDTVVIKNNTHRRRLVVTSADTIGAAA
ncbi:hypothetical protein [Actinomycetospora sp. CA-053990]|uniref:hypothetical protein n=1 Tax=Actinomycetospora sp. CA-053990 TaxID=3239891 RepID=UPI003D90B87E